MKNARYKLVKAVWKTNIYLYYDISNTSKINESSELPLS